MGDAHERHPDVGSRPPPVRRSSPAPSSWAVVGPAGEVPVHDLLGKTVMLGIKLDLRGAWPAQRIEIGNHVSTNAVRPDELIDTILKGGDFG